jgi:hypothetical protein
MAVFVRRVAVPLALLIGVVPTSAVSFVMTRRMLHGITQRSKSAAHAVRAAA